VEWRWEEHQHGEEAGWEGHPQRARSNATRAEGFGATQKVTRCF
jgi:hypothetical protein